MKSTLFNPEDQPRLVVFRNWFIAAVVAFLFLIIGNDEPHDAQVMADEVKAAQHDAQKQARIDTRAHQIAEQMILMEGK